MDSERIRNMLSHCIQGKRVPDIYLRSKGFSNEEIGEVEALGYIELADTTPWGVDLKNKNRCLNDQHFVIAYLKNLVYS